LLRFLVGGEQRIENANEVDARTLELLECVQVDVDYDQHDRYYSDPS
jgi:hypothetical protein